MYTEHYVKKNVLAKPQTLSVRSPKCFETVTFSELNECLKHWINRPETLPAEAEKLKVVTCKIVDNTIVVENISFRAAQNLVLRLSTARDIFLTLKDVHCGSIKDMIVDFKKVHWPLYIRPGSKVSVRIDSFKSRIFHEGLIREVLAESLSQQNVEIVDREHGSQLLEVKLIGNRLQIFLSLAGTALYKRGYKSQLKSLAPMKEDLASACIRHAIEWIETKHSGFIPKLIYNPFAGSGTLAFEYLNAALNIAPGFFVRSYAMEEFPVFQVKSFEHEKSLILREFDQTKDSSSVPMVLCVEKSVEQCEALRNNVKTYSRTLDWSSIGTQLHVQEMDFFDCIPAALTDSLLIANPPYGHRIDGSDTSDKFFRKIFSKINHLGIHSGLVFIPKEVDLARCTDIISNHQYAVRKIAHGGLDIVMLMFTRLRG